MAGSEAEEYIMVSNLRQTTDFGLAANMALLLSLLVILSTPLSTVRAQDALQEAEQDWALTSDNCRVGAPDREFVFIDWSGACVSGFAEGAGTLTWQLSDTVVVWTGSLDSGLREGEGVAIHRKNGGISTTYTGVWRDDEFYQGTITSDKFFYLDKITVSYFRNYSLRREFSSGQVHLYYFKNNEVDYSRASIFFTNGDNYTGEILNGLNNGFGTYTWSGGGSYTGRWLAGRRHGAGVEYDASGRVISQGIWHNGEFNRSVARALPYGTPRFSSGAEQAPPTYYAPCAENGSCYGDLSTYNGLPKTVHVEGYYRSDGTYVRGHYRSNGN